MTTQYLTSSDALSWAVCDADQLAPPPLLVCGSATDRAAAISRLAAERARRPMPPTTFWASAVAPRGSAIGFGARDASFYATADTWPQVSPFTLMPPLAEWWMHAAAPVRARDAALLSGTLQKVMGALAGARAAGRAPGFRQTAAALESVLRSPSLAQALTAPGSFGSAAGDRTTLAWPSAGLVWAQADPAPTRPREPELVLWLLAFLSHAMREPHAPALLVLDGWLDTAGAPALTLATRAIRESMASAPGLHVLIGTNAPRHLALGAAGQAMLHECCPVVTGPCALPASWEADGLIDGFVDRECQRVLVGRRVDGRLAWKTTAVPVPTSRDAHASSR